VTSDSAALPDAIRDHWWWRPGWAVGRSFYTWHITFDSHLGLRRLADFYAPVLARLPMLDPVPAKWLHLTMQGIGFTDEVDSADVEAIVQAAQNRCAQLTSFKATFGPPSVDAEAIKMDARPVDRLVDLRDSIRDAIAEIWGHDRVPEPAEGWQPHVSLAYSNAAGPAQPIADALAAHTPQTGEVGISAVSLIKLNRDRRMYEWDDVAIVRLGRTVESVD